MCSSALQTDLAKPPWWSACVSNSITASYWHDASCNHHSSNGYLLTAPSCLAELSSRCFNSFFSSLCSSQFSTSCSLVWFSMDLKHILVHCHPLFILPGTELFFSRRGWNSPISLQLNGYNLWPRKVMDCGVHLRGNPTDQQLSFTCLLSVSSSQNKAQGQGETTGKKKGRAIKG